jgi:hypothetical protein
MYQNSHQIFQVRRYPVKAEILSHPRSLPVKLAKLPDILLSYCPQ